MNRDRWKRKIVWLLAIVISASGIVNTGAMKEVKAATTIAAKSINMKQSDNTIAGIGMPTSTENTATAWEGDYVYFGTYNGSPVKFRVLDTRETNYGDTTLLLDSDEVLKQMKFRDSYTNVTWQGSDVQTWMNGSDSGQFLESFTIAEQNAIIASTKASAVGAGEFPSEKYTYVALTGQKVFALDASEANYSGYGYANDATRIKQGGIGEWWLRSKNPEVKDAICTVYNDGNIYNYYFPNYEKVGASPAVNIDLDAVLFASAYNQEKAETFSSVETSTTNEWKLTIKAIENDLQAATTDAVIFYANQAEGTVRSLNVTHSAANAVLGDATQASAVLTDAIGTVLYYGKIGEASATASTVTLPEDLPIGNYNLYVFAEDVNGITATDYASSLGTPIAITVKSEESAVANTVTVVNGAGGGEYEAGATVEIRANMADEGKQFKNWEVTEGAIVLADAESPVTSFEMGNEAVTVTAVYEDITETSNTGENLQLIWIGLLAVVVIAGAVLLVVRRRLGSKC